jgi:hypothetical protein
METVQNSSNLWYLDKKKEWVYKNFLVLQNSP